MLVFVKDFLVLLFQWQVVDFYYVVEYLGKYLYYFVEMVLVEVCFVVKWLFDEVGEVD